MTGVRRDGLAAACCALIALIAGTARADELCTREDAQAARHGAANASAPANAASETVAIATEAAHPLPPVSVVPAALPAPARRGFWPAFVEHFDLGTRLRAIKRLKIVPVFDNARVTVFLGVDRSGVAGLHIQQQAANDLPPLFARSFAPSEAPPLRAVPLRSP